MNKKISMILVGIVGAIMAIAVADMPDFGDPNSPASSHVSPTYILEAYDVAGVHNIVTAVLVYWRAYDTFGEITVIFAAGIAIMALLGWD
ncbi:hydrogen gas-evolving membrane-bound hydrogenase subunit E [Methanonatronarchaeum sp. AMET-Sl]|uniref:hydrogen gas-evolving membrane-bound hydrogenase subunit E n=1 Tax=Methanonatronarchaeum sp. AMET-Sl TaxID=3037654 RepID=UPI00244DD2FF|nr:hydrogen gas-evolving membrane-bound hydrogenase subunit E [Methanonatronarchaeum sp. AMET-Sl]WGI17500.1 hypothetical protein QEN48_00400 [Methanonatronarchaeum sp. AMET-Sl]